ncbi:MAG TPA: hypothetical protein VF862_05645 [Gemmatimonadales bacterium]
MRRWVRSAATAGVLCACAGDASPPPIGDPAAAVDTTRVAAPPVTLIDPDLPPAIAGEGGWDYQQTAEADLDGDGQAERVVLTARVELYRGRPAWDDGQPWQVYVEAPDGRRTRVYAQRLQLGTLTLRLGLAGPGQPATVVLLEHLPDRLSLYEAWYAGPDRVAVAVRFQRDLDPRGETASPRLP